MTKGSREVLVVLCLKKETENEIAYRLVEQEMCKRESHMAGT